LLNPIGALLLCRFQGVGSRTQPIPQQNEETPTWRNVLTIGAGSLLVLHLVMKYTSVLAGAPWPESGGLDTTSLVLVVVALLPWMATHLTSAKLPGGVEVAFREVQRRQEINERAILQLRFIVDGFLTRFEYQHLRNIRDNVGYDSSAIEEAVGSELRRLRALGLMEQVVPTRGVGGFTAHGLGTRRIGDWFRLTPRGIEYLRMREENDKSAADDEAARATRQER
jgi:hypothetical protein